MTQLDIIQPDNPVLRKQALRVSDFCDDFQHLVDDMYQTMMASEGVGIAGPQVARSLRVFLARLPDDEESRELFGEDAGKLYVVANPKIVRRSETIVSGVEGCLSLPGLLGDVDRHECIEITGQDRHGNPLSLRARDWLARVFQHEIDHLDGRLFIDIATQVWRPDDDDTLVEVEA
jgi:peptide deformylase